MLYLLLILSPSIALSTSGVGLEFLAELSYPVHEAIGSSIAIQMQSIFGLLFFASQIFMLDKLHPSYLWPLPLITCAVCVIPVLFLQAEYKRLAIDQPDTEQLIKTS